MVLLFQTMISFLHAFYESSIFDDLEDVFRHAGNIVFFSVAPDAVIDFDFYGISFLAMVGEVFGFDEQQTIVDSIAEENTGE